MIQKASREPAFKLCLLAYAVRRAAHCHSSSDYLHSVVTAGLKRAASGVLCAYADEFPAF